MNRVHALVQQHRGGAAGARMIGGHGDSCHWGLLRGMAGQGRGRAGARALARPDSPGLSGDGWGTSPDVEEGSGAGTSLARAGSRSGAESEPACRLAMRADSARYGANEHCSGILSRIVRTSSGNRLGARQLDVLCPTRPGSPDSEGTRRSSTLPPGTDSRTRRHRKRGPSDRRLRAPAGRRGHAAERHR